MPSRRSSDQETRLGRQRGERRAFLEGQAEPQIELGPQGRADLGVGRLEGLGAFAGQGQGRHRDPFAAEPLGQPGGRRQAGHHRERRRSRGGSRKCQQAEEEAPEAPRKSYHATSPYAASGRARRALEVRPEVRLGPWPEPRRAPNEPPPAPDLPLDSPAGRFARLARRRPGRRAPPALRRRLRRRLPMLERRPLRADAARHLRRRQHQRHLGLDRSADRQGIHPARAQQRHRLHRRQRSRGADLPRQAADPFDQLAVAQPQGLRQLRLHRQRSRQPRPAGLRPHPAAQRGESAGHLPGDRPLQRLLTTHTLEIDADSGFLYSAGSNTCNGGLHIVDIRQPLTPVFAGCFSSDGYTHEAQCTVYHGPDAAWQGKRSAWPATSTP